MGIYTFFSNVFSLFYNHMAHVTWDTIKDFDSKHKAFDYFPHESFMLKSLLQDLCSLQLGKFLRNSKLHALLTINYCRFGIQGQDFRKNLQTLSHFSATFCNIYPYSKKIIELSSELDEILSEFRKYFENVGKS